MIAFWACSVLATIISRKSRFISSLTSRIFPCWIAANVRASTPWMSSAACRLARNRDAGPLQDGGGDAHFTPGGVGDAFAVAVRGGDNHEVLSERLEIYPGVPGERLELRFE